jgi:MFS family permease
MALSLGESVFSQSYVTLTGGAFLIGYALALGSGVVLVAWLAAIPFLAQVTQLGGAWLTDAFGRRKALALAFLGAGRLAWLGLIPLAFLGPGRGPRIAMVVIVGVSSAVALAGAVPWLAWLADLVPAQGRGRWVARRQQIVGVVTIAAALGGGALLDLLTEARGAAVAFAALFGLAGVASLLSQATLWATPDPVPAPRQGLGIGRGLGEVFRNRGFRKVLWGFVLWNAAVGLSAPFFAVYMLENLAMSYSLVALHMCLVAATALLTNPVWGRLVDHFGVRPVLLLNSFLIALVPLFWLFPRPDWLLPVWLEAVFSGVVWTGFNLAAFSLPLAATPSTGRPYYLAILSVATGLGFGVAAIAGGMVGKLTQGFHWDAPWGTPMLSFHVVFLVSGLLRLLAALRMRGFEEPGAKATGFMIQVVGYAALKRLSLGRQWLVLPRRPNRRRHEAGRP